MTELYRNQAFTISRADDSRFEGEALRALFEYRKLGFRHREVRHCDDLALLEIVSPARFGTTESEAP